MQSRNKREGRYVGFNGRHVRSKDYNWRQVSSDLAADVLQWQRWQEHANTGNIKFEKKPEQGYPFRTSKDAEV